MTDEDLEAFEQHWTDLWTAEPIPARWVIESLLPVGLVGLVGPPKESMKSTQALACAIATAGEKSSLYPEWMLSPERVHRDGDVLYVSAEAEAGELLETALHGLGAHAGKIGGHSIYVAKNPMRYRLDEPQAGQKRLLHAMDLIDPRLVILDPLTRLHSSDENDAGAMSRMMWPLRSWAVEHSACVLFVHHTRKLGVGEKTYKAQDARGTSDWQGMVDGTLTISPLEGHVQIDTVFKRGMPWSRRLILGAFGAKAAEVLTDVDNKVLAMVDAGESAEDIARKCKVHLSIVLEAGKKRERNR